MANEPQDELTIGRSRDSGLRLEDVSVSRHHATLRRAESGRCELVDTGSRKGTFVNNTRIRRKTLNEGDLVRFGASVPYRFTKGHLNPCPEDVGVMLEIEGVSVRHGGREILRDLSLRIEPDEFVGIVGPSGCGKTTLLSLLSGDATLGGGRIVWDGDRDLVATREAFSSLVGVVPQEDLLFSELTVYENLFHAAKIRCFELDEKAREGRIQAAIEWVELEEHRDKTVSVLSGGQRKRANVAVELLRRPRLLLLDEPTSGLDPDLEVSLLDRLRGLARRGVTVIAVVHSRRLDPFDRVVALRNTEGDPSPSLVFCGPPENLGEAVRTGADDRSASTSSLGDSQTRSRLRLASNVKEGPARELRPMAAVVFQRSILCFLRDRQSVSVSAALPLVLGVLIVLSQRNQTDPAHICFFLVISAFWMGANAGVREIVRERRLFLRDRLAGLPPLAFLLGKASGGMLVVGIQSVLLMVTATLLIKFGGIVDELVAGRFVFPGVIVAFLALLLIGGAGLFTGLLVSVLARTERGAVAALPLILLPQILLSRVAYGDAGASLEKAPFGVIAAFPSEGFVDWVLYLGSLGFATRPGSMLMTLGIEGGVGTGKHFIEWLYGLVLIAIYGIIMTVAFLERQGGWAHR